MSNNNTLNSKVFSSKVFPTTLVLLLTIACFSYGQQESRWTGTDGNWSDPANWDNGVPSRLDTAIIGSQAGQVLQDVTGLTLARLELDSASANLVLQNSLRVEQSLTWINGKLSGDSALEFFGVGEINGGDLEATFDNYGSVEFGSNGEFARLESIAGGVWNNRSGSVANASNGVLFGSFAATGKGVVNIEANSALSASNSLQTVWDFNNSGRIELVDGLAFIFADFFQSSDADLIMTDGGIDFFQISDLAGLVKGNGSIGNLTGPIEAQLEPGGQQIGLFSTFGSFSMAANTVTNIQIGPNFVADQITNAGGPFQLNGVLNIEALPGAAAGAYPIFFYNNGFMLQVDPIQLGTVPAGFQGFLSHDPQMQVVNLIVESIDAVLLGDVNCDGAVDLLDVQPFVDLLADGEFQVKADINGDGAVDLLDVTGFIALLSA